VKKRFFWPLDHFRNSSCVHQRNRSLTSLRQLLAEPSNDTRNSWCCWVRVDVCALFHCQTSWLLLQEWFFQLCGPQTTSTKTTSLKQILFNPPVTSGVNLTPFDVRSLKIYDWHHVFCFIFHDFSLFKDDNWVNIKWTWLYVFNVLNTLVHIGVLWGQFDPRLKYQHFIDLFYRFGLFFYDIEVTITITCNFFNLPKGFGPSHNQQTTDSSHMTRGRGKHVQVYTAASYTLYLRAI